MEKKQGLNIVEFTTFVLNQLRLNSDRRQEIYNNLIEMAIREPNSKDKIELINNCWNLCVEVYFPEKMSNKDIIIQYADELFTDHKRRYNMGKLYNPELIGNFIGENREKGNIVLFKKHENSKINYYCADDNMSFHIRHIGELEYINSVGVKNSINKYEVIKGILGQEKEKYEVYTNIFFPLLERNVEYRKAVFDELFSDENLYLSGGKGYIGEILLTGNNKILNVGEEAFINGDYEFRCSKNCVLKYDGAAFTATAIHETEEAAKNKKLQTGDLEEDSKDDSKGDSIEDSKGGEER